MSIEDNLYKIQQINANTTFFDWVNHYNENVVGKLNNIEIYNGLSGDGINLTIGTTASNDPVGGETSGSDLQAGYFRISLNDTINKGITFLTDVSVDGELKIKGNLTDFNKNSFKWYGNTSGFSFGMSVRPHGEGITYAKSSSPTESESIGIITGITNDYITITTHGIIEGDFTSIAGGTLHPGCVYFLDWTTLGGLTHNEPLSVGYVSKPTIIGITSPDANTSKALVVNYRGQYLSLGLTAGAGATHDTNIITVKLNGASSGHSYTTGKVVGYSANSEDGYDGWFLYEDDSTYSLELAVGIIVNTFELASEQYIQVIGSGYISSFNNINNQYGLLYIGYDGTLRDNGTKPMAFAWRDGSTGRAYVVNQSVMGAGSTPALRSGGGFAASYQLSSNRGATYGQAIQPNLLINGGFDIWQRRIGTDGIYGSTGSTYFSDKWLRLDGCSSGRLQVSEIERKEFDVEQTDVEGLPTYYSRLKHYVNGSSSGDYVYIVNRMEDPRFLSGEKVTMSFYANSGVTGSTLGFVVVQQGNSDYNTTLIGNGFGATYDSGYIFLGTTWKKYAVSFQMPEVPDGGVGSIASDVSGGHVDIGFNITNIGNTNLNIAQVKLERGQVPTIFEPVDKRLEYDKCKRYYQRSYSYQQKTHNTTMINGQPKPTIVDFGITPSQKDHYHRFPVQMRDVPGVTIYSPYSGITGTAYNRTAMKDLILTSGTSNNYGFRLAPAGAPTIIPEIITEDGIKFQVLNGVVDFDAVSLHYVADSDLNRIQE